MSILFLIPTIGNHPGLKSAIESVKIGCLRAHINYEIQLITENNMLKYEYADTKSISVIPCSKGTRFTEKVNLGLRSTMNRNSGSDIVCIMNDDIYFAKDSISEIVDCIDKRVSECDIILNPFSNCDKGWLHNQETGFGIGIPVKHVDDDMVERINTVQSLKYPYDVVDTKHVAFFCTFIKTSTIQKYGYLDESLKTVCSDFEYCDRVKNSGGVVGWVPKAFVFHFGAVTRKQKAAENQIEHEKEDKADQIAFIRKRKRVLLVSGQSWEKWDIRNLYSGGIGGSETCLLYLGRHLVQNGYEVDAIIDCENPHIADGVKYHSYKDLSPKHFPFNNNYDVAIASRVPYMIEHLWAKKKILWCHDIAFGDKKSIDDAGKFDHIVLLSDWHREFWKQFGHDGKVTVIPDGIELERFKNHNDRQYGHFIYSSSWDRGLDNLIYILGEVRNRTGNKNVRLDVYYGNENLIKTANALHSQELLDFNRDINKMVQDNSSWVEIHSRVNQNALAQEMGRSFAWVYPTFFEETCCITLIEAMAAGLPIVHNGYAGLQRFTDTGVCIHYNGKLPSILFNKNCDTKLFEPFIEVTIELLQNPTLWRELSNKSLVKANQYAWQKVVRENWIKLLET